jgi:phosphopantothenoylcysteine decarboxylase/phosphopantothenate--cysteine ligase
MWENSATKRNVAQIQNDGVQIIAPSCGTLACGENGVGKMAEIEIIVQTVLALVGSCLALSGKKIIVTAGATFEAIDPVRFLGNRSSGKQGFAIAQELARAGADITLISGVSNLSDVANVKMVRVTSALEMLEAVERELPVDIAVFTAAVSDFRPKNVAENKIKKSPNSIAPTIELVENPDILKIISNHQKRPKLVVGFAAETENLLENASKKRTYKNCDWLLANNVAGGKVFEQESNEITFISEAGYENWAQMSKQNVAQKLVEKIIESMKK